MVAASSREICRIVPCAIALLMAVPAAASERCKALLPDDAVSNAAPVRNVRASDLATLRDIGEPDGSILGRSSPIAVSPDAENIAFLLSRGDPASNDYCRAVVVMATAPGAKPRIVARDGEFIKQTGAYRGLVATVGYPEIVTPQWRPDGSAVAYLRQKSGVTQIWLAPIGSAPSRPLTTLETDVESFAWSEDGARIVFATRLGRIAEREAIGRESRVGFLYDARYVPNAGPVPRPSADVPRDILTLTIATRDIAQATEAERARLVAVHETDGSGERSVRAEDGRRAGTEPGASPLSPARLWAEDRLGNRVICEAATCTGPITGLWWEADTGDLLFMRREGWARGVIALYRWDPGSAPPDRIYATDDVIDGCVSADANLICTLETVTQPRRLVSLDPDSGEVSVLFDPNPEFARLRLGRVERLFWRNDLGLEVRGDLVLPPDYRLGMKLPLIVTQYFSNGFLRGGTGDEYPIHPFAVRGFAVLSLERPTFFAAAFPEIQTFEEVNAANARGWGERKSLLSALETGIGLVIGKGVADPARIGLTGLSDGATTVAFALINGRFDYAAASISSCCYGRWTTMSIGGIAYADRMRRLGYPPASSGDAEFWRPISLAANAASIDTPLLMQLADDEYLLALETFTALREHNQPVEMFVFPDEHHIKWQPAHRLAIYERNLAWFDFWLRGVLPEDRDQAARWIAMGEQSGMATGLTTRPPARPRHRPGA